MSDGTTTWNYTYNADGLRTSRTNGTTTYKYIYNGSSLVQMTVGNDTLYFTDATVTYNNTVYYYVKNIQGDVIAILNTAGTAVVQYTYDAWGNILSTTGELANTLGQINPLRYRGYVYDHETGLYYLQSRYYDPEIGRFLNADAFASTGQGILGNNMFAYCGNNPVNYCDPTGQKFSTAANHKNAVHFKSEGAKGSAFGQFMQGTSDFVQLVSGKQVLNAGHYVISTGASVAFDIVYTISKPIVFFIEALSAYDTCRFAGLGFMPSVFTSFICDNAFCHPCEYTTK